MAPYDHNIKKVAFRHIHRAICIVVLASFIITSVNSPASAQMASIDQMPFMPKPGVMIHLSPEYTPAHLKGIIIHPENPLKFDFLISRGDEFLNTQQKHDTYQKLIKYFLASLAVPDEDQWVNLSPYEKDRIIKSDFGKTEMGRDLLAQDYMLKQITASLIYPKDNLGKKFWDRVFAEAQEKYGTTNIPFNTFNKVWIIPDSADVYEHGNMVYVVSQHLKVMLEEDYLSLAKHSGIISIPPLSYKEGLGEFRGSSKTINALGSQVVRAIVLPALEKEVNEGKNFATLRQVYSGMILAAWYKYALKQSFLGQIYANKGKLKGVDQDPRNNEFIYKQYLRAFKKGVFNYIQEDVDKYSQETIPRKYFSGGMKAMTVELLKKVMNRVGLNQVQKDRLLSTLDRVTALAQEAFGAKPRKNILTKTPKGIVKLHAGNASMSALPPELIARLKKNDLQELIAAAVFSENGLDFSTVLRVVDNLVLERTSSFFALTHHQQMLFARQIDILNGKKPGTFANETIKAKISDTIIAVSKLENVAKRMKTLAKDELQVIAAADELLGCSLDFATASRAVDEIAHGSFVTFKTLAHVQQEVLGRQIDKLSSYSQGSFSKVGIYMKSMTRRKIKMGHIPQSEQAMKIVPGVIDQPIDELNGSQRDISTHLANTFAILPSQVLYKPTEASASLADQDLTAEAIRGSTKVVIKRDGETIHTVNFILDRESVSSLVFSSNGKYLTIVYTNGETKVIDLNTFQPVNLADLQRRLREQAEHLLYGPSETALEPHQEAVTHPVPKKRINRKSPAKSSAKRSSTKRNSKAQKAMKSFQINSDAEPIYTLTVLKREKRDAVLALASLYAAGFRATEVTEAQYNSAEKKEKLGVGPMQFYQLEPNPSSSRTLVAAASESELNGMFLQIPDLESLAPEIIGFIAGGDRTMEEFEQFCLGLGLRLRKIESTEMGNVFRTDTRGKRSTRVINGSTGEIVGVDGTFNENRVYKIVPLQEQGVSFEHKINLFEQKLREFLLRQTPYITFNAARESGTINTAMSVAEELDKKLELDLRPTEINALAEIISKGNLSHEIELAKTGSQGAKLSIKGAAINLANIKRQANAQIEVYRTHSGEVSQKNRAPRYQGTLRDGTPFRRNDKSNRAMSLKGGIDFNSANLRLRIKRDGKGVPLPLSQQDMAQINNLEGLDPVILQIRPATSLPFFSQLQGGAAPANA